MVKIRARRRLNPERHKGFSIFQNSSVLFWVPPSSISNTYQVSLPGVKLPGCKFYIPSSAKDKNEWMYVDVCGCMCPCAFMASTGTIVLLPYTFKNCPKPVVYFKIGLI
jgi:hypothetical protein